MKRYQIVYYVPAEQPWHAPDITTVDDASFPLTSAGFADAAKEMQKIQEQLIRDDADDTYHLAIMPVDVIPRREPNPIAEAMIKKIIRKTKKGKNYE